MNVHAKPLQAPGDRNRGGGAAKYTNFHILQTPRDGHGPGWPLPLGFGTHTAREREEQRDARVRRLVGERQRDVHNTWQLQLSCREFDISVFELFVVRDEKGGVVVLLAVRVELGWRQKRQRRQNDGGSV